jgi:integrase
LRRSELVALNVDDVDEDADGLVLRIRRSKQTKMPKAKPEVSPTDHNPRHVRCEHGSLGSTLQASTQVQRFGVSIGTAACATRLSDRAVADMIKRRAAAAGLDGLFAGHSLRSGFATEGYAQGTPELAIMRHGRWKSASVMRGYVQAGTIWTDNAATRLGQ